MKKLILVALLVVGTTSVAQQNNRKHHQETLEHFTPDQRSQLMLKKMTLDLDLNDSQQKEMSTIISDKIAKKEAFRTKKIEMKVKGVKPTVNERFEMQIQLLDEQIASKKRMQQILNAKQFEKWTSLKEEHNEDRHNKHKRKRLENRED